LLEAERDINRWRDAAANKRRRTEISQEILYAIVSDRTPLKYAHLEGFALALNVPASLILLFSRLYANQTNQQHSQTRQIVRAFIKVFEDLAQLVLDPQKPPHTFAIDDFYRWEKFFNDAMPRPAIQESFLSEPNP
jgi:hypothetical protein